MITVIHGSERHRHSELMEEVFRIRYRDFVLRRGWSLPTRDSMDIDQYDDDEAIYLIVRNDAGAILATSRLNQTSRSSLLADLFPSLIETGEPARGPTIWEGTRFTLDPAMRSKAEIRAARAELGCTAAMLVLERGGRHIQAVVDFSAFPAFMEMSPRTRPLGLPQPYGGGIRSSGGGRCIAFRWDLSPELVRDFEAYGCGEHLDADSYADFETIN